VIVDLCAGARGWEAASDVDAVGFELDRDACRTSAAAGYKTVRCDLFDYPIPHGVEGVIASPPCQPFSQAGNRTGMSVLADVVRFIDTCADGWHEPEAAWRRDPRIGLVVEPLCWALKTSAAWCAWEQVPDVLPVWEACARVLRAHSWSAWAGVLSAEQYGVPQTRERAFLIASRFKTVQPPTPTHQAYRPGESANHGPVTDLFGHTILPWVSMAEALGWPDHRVLETNRGQDEYGNRQTRTSDLPAPSFTTKAGAQWCWDRPATTVVGSFRPDIIAAPGYRLPGDGPRQNAPGSVQVTIYEALALQSFPRDWPLVGNKTSRERQVGNAVPPLLAAAVLRSVA
jgi:DNA (cytosine-5)-methyltransferase 1